MRMTRQEYLAYEARRTKVAINSDGVDEEGELHAAILEECARRDWLVFHGSMAHKTYRTEGENDFHVLADSGHIFLVEAKSKHGKLSVKQKGVIAWAKKLGHTIHVVSSIDDFIAVSKMP